MVSNYESLWGDPITTPQELIEENITLLEIRTLNARYGFGEMPDAVEEMKNLLALFRQLDIGS